MADIVNINLGQINDMTDRQLHDIRSHARQALADQAFQDKALESLQIALDVFEAVRDYRAAMHPVGAAVVAADRLNDLQYIPPLADTFSITRENRFSTDATEVISEVNFELQMRALNAPFAAPKNDASQPSKNFNGFKDDDVEPSYTWDGLPAFETSAEARKDAISESTSLNSFPNDPPPGTGTTPYGTVTVSGPSVQSTAPSLSAPTVSPNNISLPASISSGTLGVEPAMPSLSATYDALPTIDTTSHLSTSQYSVSTSSVHKQAHNIHNNLSDSQHKEAHNFETSYQTQETSYRTQTVKTIYTFNDPYPDTGFFTLLGGEQIGLEAEATSFNPVASNDTKRDHEEGITGGTQNSGDENGNYNGGHTPSDDGSDRPPIILNLDGTQIAITELSNSTKFIDSGGDGLEHRTAWAAAGNGVLFYDADGDGTISEKKEYVFTEWDPTATSDIEALRAYFDTNGDGVFDSSDDAWSDFKVLVTNADGTYTAQTLAQLGITSIDLTADATSIELPDGSMITGQTTFTYADGTTGLVGDTTLASDAQGYRVERVESTDASGNLVVISSAYGADGQLAYAITSVTSPSGDSIENTYDDTGNGVVDRIQTIGVVDNTASGGDKVETVTNFVGADTASAVLANRTVTTTSATGDTVTVERDSTGGGWFDQVEIRSVLANDSRTVAISDLANDGSVIISSFETISADGLSRSTAVDMDGDGVTDVTTNHTIVVHADGSRTTRTEQTNSDGTPRSTSTETVSADGQTKTRDHDLDGDGDTDRLDLNTITVNGDGSSASSTTIQNGDGSLRTTTTQTQSSDALTKTVAQDIDGDGITDVTQVDATVINADDSRSNTVTVSNADGSVRSMQQVTLAADKITSETRVDLNQDGTFDTTDLVKSVTVDGTTQERTATSWARNADGSVNAQSVSVTSADGLTITSTLDANGDGVTNTQIFEQTIVDVAGVASKTVSTTNFDGSLRGSLLSTTSANGLIRVQKIDRDGDGIFDAKTIVENVQESDGARVRTVESFAGDESTLLSKTVSHESADRLTTTSSVDVDGDGVWDSVSVSLEGVDGDKSVTQTRYHADGDIASTSTSQISANGLTATTSSDSNGDGVNETTTIETTVLNTDGSRTQNSTINNGDGTSRGFGEVTVGDDGLVITSKTDADGDGVFERETTDATVLNADGSITRTVTAHSADGSNLGVVQTTRSDDGLSTTVLSDGDGDGDFDLRAESLTTLNADGSTTVVVERLDANAVLFGKTTTTRSDNGRDVITETDINGDGVVDMVATRTIADDGTVTVITSETATDGSLYSQSETVTNATGLSTTSRLDRDGDGVFEAVVVDDIVLNTDGSSTRTTLNQSADGTTYASAVTQVSDDGLTTTSSSDINNDGAIDLTTTTVDSLAADGVLTLTVANTAADGSTLSTSSRVVSADQRTVTTSVDADGNGTNDSVATSTLDDHGTRTVTSEYFSTGGTLMATYSSSVSGDGLEVVNSTDRNGDGFAELVSTTSGFLGEDGSSGYTTEYRDGNFIELGHEEFYQNDDGTYSVTSLDLNGDDLDEFVTTQTTAFEADGDVVATHITRDSNYDTRSEIETTISGDGLRTHVEADYSGDGNADRTTDQIVLADGSWSTQTTEFDTSFQIMRTETAQESADGRTRTTSVDLDGDGTVDRATSAHIDLDRTTTTVFEDVGLNGSVEASVTSVLSANGSQATWQIDVDGDGSTDLSRSTSHSFGTNGDIITVLSEQSGAGVEFYRETSTTSADGLSSSTTFDVNGDGIADGTSTSQTTLNDDGSRTTLNETDYADGELRSKVSSSTSADGRSVEMAYDYDGNGINDKTHTSVKRADGSHVGTKHYYNEAGQNTEKQTITTSADGLMVKILRGDFEQTLERSVLDNGSYTWDNGVDVAGQTRIQSVHEVDALGVETWTVTYSDTTGTLNTIEVQLDQGAKARLLSEAARLYDTVLDRDMDFAELEVLIEHFDNGELDKAGLASELMGNGEFATRYGTMSNAEFVTQMALNAFGRAPLLEELDTYLQKISDGLETREEVALAMSESSEHLVVGNGHRLTNNFDVILNPATFERSLDKANVEAMIKKLVDTVYDREATDQELAQLSKRLLEDDDRLDDIATTLLGVEGDVHGIESSSLNGLSGLALVEQAFLNSVGRLPTGSEATTWTNNISQGVVTAAQFIASLAMSTDFMREGVDQNSTAAAAVSTQVGTSGADNLSGTSAQDNLDGGAGNDVLYGGAGADVLDGGVGVDNLQGGAGNDHYYWSKGDGNDTLSDTSTSRIETDTLVFTDVASNDVELTRTHGSTYLKITIISTGEVITDIHRFHSIAASYGLEAIEFSDGVTWDLETILEQTQMVHTSGNDVLYGSAYGDNIVGGDGADNIRGNGGDDTIEGGLGNDIYLHGFEGSDTYVWSKGDGNDTIWDISTSLTDIDRLLFTDVLSSDVALTRAHGSGDLKITVTSTGEVITVTHHYNTVANGYGLEVIEFSDGAMWGFAEIATQTRVAGASGNDVLHGRDHDDHIYGGAGNDTLSGIDGDDVIEGGLGADSLYGGAGSDTYVWSKGDGNDTLVSHGSDVTSDGVDRLIFTDVQSDDVELTRANNSTHVQIKILSTGEVITDMDRFYSTTQSYGLEAIEFSDGVTWALEDILARTKLLGTASGEILNGTVQNDNIFGLGGADTLYGGSGNDKLFGGAGNDNLQGGVGNDQYHWSIGDGSDTIYDASTSTTEVDTLVLGDVAFNGAVLSKDGDDLKVTIGATGEVLTVSYRFHSSGSGYGTEKIFFSDGVTTEVLDSPVAEAIITGTGGYNLLDGWVYKDIIYGHGGNDNLRGWGGDDTIEGGTGADLLYGGAGDDTFVWSKGDGNDTLMTHVTDVSEHAVDRLFLTNVASDDVELTRVHGSQHLQIKIVSTGEVITDQYQYHITSGYGLEEIEFSDGTIWALDDILANTHMVSTSGNDVLYGSEYQDNIFGGAGVDLLSGYGDDDTIAGGTGADNLYGGAGNDAFLWSKGDGNDTLVSHASDVTADYVDRLILLDVASDDIELTRTHGYQHLQIKIISTGEVITDQYQYHGTSGYGLEVIEFSDGVIWALDDILAHTEMVSTSGNDVLYGTDYADNIRGGDGADNLQGWNGDDTIEGGLGNDTQLHGREGSDTYVWSKGDGNDTIWDVSTSLTDIDRLRFTDVDSTDVALTRAHGSTNLVVTIVSTGEVITITHHYHSLTNGYGLELFEFSDGVIWLFDDIAANTRLEGGTGNDVLHGRDHADYIVGNAGNDTLSGIGGDDTIEGGTGADSLYGGAGSDTFIWTKGDGNDTLVSHASDVSSYGVDRLILTDVSSNGVELTRTNNSTHLQIKIISTGEVITDMDRFYSTTQSYGLEAIEFSDGTIWILDDIFANTQTLGTSAGEILNGTANIDNIFGYEGDDTLLGGSGNDTLNGGAGADDLNGGSGEDTASYAGSTTRAFVDLRVGGIIKDAALGDTLTSIENLIGTDHNDYFYANDDDNVIFGGAGDDLLRGHSGDDRLVGGTGNDNLHGGSGSDTFVFNSDDITGHDVITDFALGTDRIEFEGATTFVDLSIDQSSGVDTVITWDANSITLSGVTGGLGVVDFDFV